MTMNRRRLRHNVAAHVTGVSSKAQYSDAHFLDIDAAEGFGDDAPDLVEQAQLYTDGCGQNFRDEDWAQKRRRSERPPRPIGR